jgi:hypothetical protein
MRSLFRALDRERVRYLVISGQACILYGASQLKDIDLGSAAHETSSPARDTAWKRTSEANASAHDEVTRKATVSFRIGRELFLDVMGPTAWELSASDLPSSRVQRIENAAVRPGDLVLLKRTNRRATTKRFRTWSACVSGSQRGSRRCSLGAPEHVRVGDLADYAVEGQTG